jgi:NitT/TauT family transport system substrate-binding protein
MSLEEGLAMKRVLRTAPIHVLVLALLVLMPIGLGAQTKTTFCASWIINVERAYAIAALDKGFFKAQGLDVDYVRGYGSGDTFKRVGTGGCDIAETAAGPVVLGRAKALMAKLVAMQSHKFEESLYFFADSGVQTPKDLLGRRVTGGPKASSNTQMFPIFARANGIDPSKVEMVYMTADATIPALASGKVDAAVGYHRTRPSYEKAARQAGKKLQLIIWADHGLDLYSGGITASDETIAKKGDFILRFLRGMFEGMAWSLKNPEATIDLYVKKHPEFDKETGLETFRLVQDFWFDSYYPKEGLGHMNREKMVKTIRVTLEAAEVQASLTPEDVMTNEFVDRLPRQLRFPK